MLNVRLFVFIVFYLYSVLKSKEKLVCYFFFLEKITYFGFFLFSKKFIISYEKGRKTNNLNFENKLLSAKSQKNKHYLSFIYSFDI